MFTFDEVLLDVRQTLTAMLRNYLMFIVGGGTVDQFLQTNAQVTGLVDEVATLRQHDSVNRQNIDQLQVLINEITSTRDLAIAQVEALREQVANLQHSNHEAARMSPRADELLDLILALYRELRPNVRNPYPTEEAAPVEATTPTTPTPAPVEVETQTPQRRNGIFDTINVEFEVAAEPAQDPVQETPQETPVQEDEHYDLDDEDLEQAAQNPSVPAGTIIKNPEIREDFTSLESSNMIMFIFVRYSQLPYHYIVDGIRHKFIVSGSNIVSSVV